MISNDHVPYGGAKVHESRLAAAPRCMKGNEGRRCRKAALPFCFRGNRIPSCPSYVCMSLHASIQLMQPQSGTFRVNLGD